MNELIARAFDAIPSLVFVVDGDVRILEYNSAAAALLSEEKTAVLKMRGGDALHCMHSRDVEGGCGHAPACTDCIVRSAVEKAFAGGSVVRSRHRMELVRDGEIQKLYVLITASPFVSRDTTYVILVLEDIGELVELRNIIPICAYCKQVRTDENYWIQVESYFKDRLDIDFTHGLCPSCCEKCRDEIKAMKNRAS